jgi:hypothetical protein
MKKYINKLKKDNPIFNDFDFELKEDERIKQVKDFPDYWISNYGNIFSYKEIRKNKWKKMTNRNKHDRYLYIFFVKNNKKYEFAIHRLVAKYFCKGYKKGLVINHKDANGLNNYYKNLEWTTQKENIHQSYLTSGINQTRNYCIYNIIYPNGKSSQNLMGNKELKNYIKNNNLNCSALSLLRWGYSKKYKIRKRYKNEI